MADNENKVSKIKINGIVANVNDPKAVCVAPPSLEIDDGYPAIVYYDFGTEQFYVGNRTHGIGLDDNEDGATPARKEQVNAKLNKSEFYKDRDDTVDIYYKYLSGTNTVKAIVKEHEGYNGKLEIKDKLDILVFSLKSRYNSTTQTYTFDHFLGCITVNTNATTTEDGHLCYTGSLQLSDTQENRILYFIVLNPIGASGQLRSNIADTLLTNPTITNQITVSSSDSGDYNTVVNLAFASAIDSAIKVKITVEDGRFGEKVTSDIYTIAANTSNYSKDIGASGYKRKVTVEIIDTLDSEDTYGIGNNVLTVNPRLDIRIFLITKFDVRVPESGLPDHRYGLIQVIDGSNYYNVNKKITRHSNYSIFGSTDIADPTEFEDYGLEILVENDLGNLPYLIEEAGQSIISIESQLNLSSNTLKMSGNNAYLIDLEGDTSPISIRNVDGNSDYFKYILYDNIGKQLEFWLLDKDRNLINCYEEITEIPIYDVTNIL